MVLVGDDHFRRGSLVEVGSDEDGFKDAWYEATILKPPWKSSTSGRKNKAQVQYHTLVTEDSKPLTEYVHATFLKPSRPRKTQSFRPNDVVDAFYRDGWWTGVVTKVVEENSKYSVFFMNPPEEIEFNISDLRVHFEWVKGKWVRPKKKITTGLNFRMRAPVEVNLEKEYSGDVWFPATFLKEVGINSFLVEYNTSGHGDEVELQNATVDCVHIRPSPPCLEEQNFELSQRVDAYYDFAWRVGTITHVLTRKRYVVSLKHSEEEKEFRDLDIRPHLEWIGGKWVIDSKEINQQIAGGMSSQMKRKGRPHTVPVKRRKDSAAGAAVEKGLKDSTELPTNTGVESTGKKYSKRIGDQKLLNESTRHENIEINEQKGGMSSQMKRKRSPPQVMVKRLKASAAGEEHNGAAGTSVEMVVKDCTELLTITGVESIGTRGSQPEIPFQLKEYVKLIRDKNFLNEPARHKNLVSNIKKMPLVKKVKLPNEKVGQVLGKHLEKNSAKSGRKRSTAINTEPPTQDSQEAPGEKSVEISETDCMKKDLAVAEMWSNTSDDDRPLLMWFEGMHSSAVLDDSSFSPGRTEKQLKETAQRHIEITGMPDKDQSLPFVKSSPVWKTLESMEVFQKMPQKPHFHPLDRCKEEFREGLAIADMVTFASLVERTSKLQFDDPRSIFNGSLEALHDLEMHGFDVEAVQGRLNELLSIKNRQGQLQDQSKEVENQILEHIHEKTNIDEEIDVIDKNIRELQEKRALVMSRKEIKDSEVATLQLSVNAINEGIRSARLDFETLAAGLW